MGILLQGVVTFLSFRVMFSHRTTSSHASYDEVQGSMQFGQKREHLGRLPKYF